MKSTVLPLLLALAGSTHAQDAALAQGEPLAPQPRGQPVAEQPPRDSDFGVRARGFGLQREVEMLQWRRSGSGYDKEWSAQPVDSSGYAPAYRNPGDFPVQTRYWIATGVTLDGKRVDDDVLKEYGRWRDFRPGFSALPANLAATFQPEGDGLGTADNPLDPQVGDLRVRWRVLELPPLQGKVALQGGVWIPASDAVADSAGVVVAEPARPHRWPWWLLAFAAVAGSAWWLRRRRS